MNLGNIRNSAIARFCCVPCHGKELPTTCEGLNTPVFGTADKDVLGARDFHNCHSALRRSFSTELNRAVYPHYLRGPNCAGFNIRVRNLWTAMRSRDIVGMLKRKALQDLLQRCRFTCPDTEAAAHPAAPKASILTYIRRSARCDPTSGLTAGLQHSSKSSVRFLHVVCIAARL